jgi:small subunit ribosomal protein S17
MSEQTEQSASELSEPTAPAPVPEGPAAPAEPSASEPAATPADSKTVPSEEASGRLNRRKVREGIVVSTAMDKTTVVSITERVRHSRYAKTVQRTKKLYAHDEANDTKVGDRVRIAESRPLSKLKRWRLVEVVERAR